MSVRGAVRNMSLAIKLFAIMGLLALTAAVVGLSGIRAIHVYRAKVAEMRLASERAIIGEQVNGLINAVVMDSRGVYMAKDAAEVDKFGEPLLDNLKRIEDRVARWSEIVTGDKRDGFEECRRQLQGFVRLRTELVEAARSQGAAAANRIGNNDANRANRQAVNVAVAALAHDNAADVTRVADDLARYEQTVATTLPAITAVSILVDAVLAGLLVIGGITRPLSRIIDTMRQLANGVLDVEVASDARADEVGRIAAALEVFRKQALDNRRLAAAEEQQRQLAEEQKRLAMRKMAEDIEAAAGSAMLQIGRQSEALAGNAQEMRARAARTGESAGFAVTAAATALTNAQIVASAAEELAASIREISAQVNHSTAVIAGAVGAGGEARATIDALNERVGRIGSVTTIIGEIAATINLLALNATIEAARAGEAGKGFAVVASEVKQLARQTARSAEEIARHIAEVRTTTGAAVAAVAGIEARVEEISTFSGAIAAAVVEQGAATAEIARNVTETVASVREITQRNTEVSAEAERGGQQAETVLGATRDLSDAVRELKTAVIRTVRTSAEEVNRRAFQRYAFDLPCQVETADRTMHAARILDVSEQGARIGGTIAMAAGARGRLHIERVGLPIDFAVVHRTDSEIRASFAPNDAEASALRTLLQHAAESQAA